MARAQTRPDDLLTLRQAAALAGRSVDTLRTWRSKHGLKDWRPSGDPSAPSMVSRADVLAILARVNAARPDLDGVIDGVVDAPRASVGMPMGGRGVDPPGYEDTPTSLGAPTPSGLAVVETLIGDLRAERDRFRLELVSAVASRDAALLRLAALEAVVAHGRRAALADERARLLGHPAPSSEPKKKKKKKKR